MTFHFVHPWALLLLLAVPFFLLAIRRTGGASILLPRAASLTGFASTGARWAAWIPPLLRALAWTLLVVALARPRTGET
nr:BatA domain-containing protein [Gemmatimonadota bacterium]